MARFLVILVLLFASALHARDVDVQNVVAAESDVARLQAQVEPAFSHVKSKTGIDDQLDLQLVVVGGSRSFAELAARDGVGMNAESVLGYAMPGRRRIVLNLSGIRERQLEPIGVLRHEIAHLVMGSALRTVRPLWFEEGVAQYVESVVLNELRESAGMNPWVDFEDLADLNQALREEARACEVHRGRTPRNFWLSKGPTSHFPNLPSSSAIYPRWPRSSVLSTNELRTSTSSN